MSGSAIVVGETECEKLQREFADLIKAVMKTQGISIRKLVDNKVIRHGHRTRFYERIAEGNISMTEFNRILDFLNIDNVKATLVLNCLKSHGAYFEPHAQTSAHLAQEITTSLEEEVSACSGTFEPIRQTLCASVAQKTSSAIVKHHEAVQQRREDVGHFERQFG